MQQIKDALLAQRKRGTASAEEAGKIIDDLGMRHMIVPVSSEKISGKTAALRPSSTKRAAAKKNTK